MSSAGEGEAPIEFPDTPRGRAGCAAHIRGGGRGVVVSEPAAAPPGGAGFAPAAMADTPGAEMRDDSGAAPRPTSAKRARLLDPVPVGGTREGDDSGPVDLTLDDSDDEGGDGEAEAKAGAARAPSAAGVGTGAGAGAGADARASARSSGSSSDVEVVEVLDESEEVFAAASAGARPSSGRGAGASTATAAAAAAPSDPPAGLAPAAAAAVGAGGEPCVRVVHDVGGVRGLSIAYELFSEAVERRLFDHPHLPFGGKGGPDANPGQEASRWGGALAPRDFPADYTRLFNAVRDSGLCPSLVHANYALQLNYPQESAFHSHFDSRYRWGEHVCGVTLGRAAVMAFTPFDKAVKARGPRPDLPTAEGSAVRVRRDKAATSDFWCVEVTVPRRSVYVMGGESRTLWKHGVLKQTQARLSRMPPPSAWNPWGYRRSITLRCTKPYNHMVLQRVLETYTRAEADASRAHAARPTAASDRALAEARSRLAAMRARYEGMPGGPTAMERSADSATGDMAEHLARSRREIAAVASSTYGDRFRPDESRVYGVGPGAVSVDCRGRPLPEPAPWGVGVPVDAAVCPGDAAMSGLGGLGLDALGALGALGGYGGAGGGIGAAAAAAAAAGAGAGGGVAEMMMAFLAAASGASAGAGAGAGAGGGAASIAGAGGGGGGGGGDDDDDAALREALKRSREDQ